jgi:hypothetical protein
MANTRYVNPDSTAGGDGTTNATVGANRAYVPLNAWEAARQAVLADVEECICETGGTADSTSVQISGWTTTASFYIDIKTSAGHRHSGVWNASKYRLEGTPVTILQMLNISEDFVRVEGIQAYQSSAANRQAFQVTANPSSDVRLTACIGRTNSTSGTATRPSVLFISSGVVAVRNCILYDSKNESGIYVSGGTVTIDNCTLAGNADYGIEVTGGTVTATNCYADGSIDSYAGTMTLTTCAHSSATVFAGSTASIAHDTTNFTNVTVGSEDYHLVSGASATLKTGGTDLSGTFTTDIDGETRSDWSIGADEIVAAPGGANPKGPFSNPFMGPFGGAI